MGASEELPRVKAEAVGPMGQVGRPGRSVSLPEAPTAPRLDIWAVPVSLVLNTCVRHCPKLVFFGTLAYFDPFKLGSRALIGLRLLP